MTSPVLKAQWEPAMPASFVKLKLTLDAIKALVRNLRTVPDVTFQKPKILTRNFS
jgi:hypothetical protein